MDEKKCPDCAEMIKRDAMVCKHCGYRYSPEDLAAQKKKDEEDGRDIGIGCLALLLVVGVSVYFLSDDEASAPVPEFQEQSDLSTDVLEENVQTLNSDYDRVLSPEMQRHGETIATVLNLNGQLCAKVVNVVPLAVRNSAFEVTCVEYRGGTGKVRYIVDTTTGETVRQ